MLFPSIDSASCPFLNLGFKQPLQIHTGILHPFDAYRVILISFLTIGRTTPTCS